MILRRFMKHVTDQNWFAVGLDVTVVIVGIFLGLQVQALYDERADRIEEREYIERLLDDVEVSLEIQQNEVETSKRHLNQILRAIEILESDNPENITIENLQSLVNNTGIMRPIRMVSGTIDELISSGKLSLVEDINLRKEMHKHKAYFDRNQSVMRLIHERSLYVFETIDLALKPRYHPDLVNNYTQYDFIVDELKNDAKFMSALKYISTVHANYVGFHQRTLDTTLSFRSVLTRNLQESIL